MEKWIENYRKYDIFLKFNKDGMFWTYKNPPPNITHKTIISLFLFETFEMKTRLFSFY